MPNSPVTIQPVILCGGVGKRLWPVSRSSSPKQLHCFVGQHTMLQNTVTMLEGVTTERPIIVCGAEYVDEIDRQVSDSIPSGNATILVEPEGRNTAPAIAAAVLAAPEQSIVVVLPSDHHLGDRQAFEASMLEAVRTAQAGRMVTFGVVPDRPATGYGYIQAGDVIDGDVMEITRFVEKPDRDTAVAFLERGDFLWNSGMFVFQRETCIEEFERHAPEILGHVRLAMSSGGDGAVRRLGDDFSEALSMPFDRAIMERTDRGAVVPLDAEWSDLGSWNSLWQIGSQDADGNVVHGDATMVDVRGSYVRSDGRHIAVLGLDDVVVIETGDAILVARRDRSQEISELVARLSEGHAELT